MHKLQWMPHRDSGEKEADGHKGICTPTMEGDRHWKKKPQFHSPERSEEGHHSLPSRKEGGWLAPNTQVVAVTICALARCSDWVLLLTVTPYLP